MGAVIKLKTRTATERSPEKKSDRHVAFTPQRIETLIRAGRDGYFYDEKTPGLAIRIGATKSVYVHAVRIGGAYQRRTLGNVSTMLLADARQAVAATAGAIALGNVPAAPRAARQAARIEQSSARVRDAFTVDAAFNDYLIKRELKAKTATTYRDVWRHMPAELLTRPIADLDGDTVAELHRSIGRKAKRTANKLIVLLSSVCDSAGRRNNNPTVDVNRFHEKPRTRRLSPDEAARLRAVLDRQLGDADIGRRMIATYVSVAVLTGARRSAISAMRWTDLDLRPGHGTWTVPAQWSKNGGELHIALTDRAVAVLEAWRAVAPRGQWVFVSGDAASGHIEEPKKGWGKIRTAAGIGDVTLHDLRRSLGSSIAARGGNAATIAGALGHMSLQSAKHYLHLNTTEIRAALEDLGQ